MGELPRMEKPVIEPVYSQTEPNQPIDLGFAAVKFGHEGKTYQDTAQAVLRFWPDPRLVFVVSLEGKDSLLGLRLLLDTLSDGKLELPERHVTLDVFCGGSSSSGGFAFAAKNSLANVLPPAQEVASALFHLFNFPNFLGSEDYTFVTGKPPSQGWQRCGRVRLLADGWRVTVAGTDKTETLCTALKQEGGYVITHMGRVEREDGSCFTTDQLTDVLRCLHYFLSFALGRWAGLAFPIGFDRSGARVFEQWGLPSAASGPWQGSCSWFDAHHGELLSQTFPGFMALWKDELWQKAMREALYWYLGAGGQRRPISLETGLILAQAALELLAWTYCVQSRKMVSAKTFELPGFSAADKLRLLASSLDIPLELPRSLRALNATPGRKWVDALDAVTGIRNSIVHPHARRKLPENSYYEAWRLSLWYIDMVLLRLCGHTGQYANRLAKRWVGQLEPVPWAKTEPQKAGT